jgi:clan AA aspartic protease
MKGLFHVTEARIDLVVFGPAGHRKTVAAVVDTGPSGWLTLPKSVIDDLGLLKTGTVRAALANGSEAEFNTYEGAVLWNRRRHRIEVEEAETTPLIGISLMAGCELKMEVWRGGDVSIKPPRRQPRVSR